MAKFGAIYLSFDEGLVEKVDEISQILKHESYVFIVRYHCESPWIQLYLEEPENISDYAYKVSKIFPNRQVMGLAAYTVSDSVSFSHFKDGKIIRLLESGFEKKRLWEKIDGTIKVVGNSQIQVPVIGILRTYEKLPVPIGFTPKSVTISRQADKWFISWKIEVCVKPTIKKVDVVGVDLGVKNFATLSTGEVFEGAKSYRKFEKKLGRLQRQQRNQTVGSRNWIKSQLKVARLHRQIANIRQDTLHKLTTYLAKNHGTIVIEDLNVSGMMANHKLAKAISDMGFYEFQRQLDYKTPLYSSKLVLADRWYPSSKTCFNCGSLKKSLSLKQRTYRCECGWECDRDLNAAYNLVRLVQSEFTPVNKIPPTVLVEAGKNHNV